MNFPREIIMLKVDKPSHMVREMVNWENICKKLFTEPVIGDRSQVGEGEWVFKGPEVPEWAKRIHRDEVWYWHFSVSIWHPFFRPAVPPWCNSLPEVLPLVLSRAGLPFPLELPALPPLASFPLPSGQQSENLHFERVFIYFIESPPSISQSLPGHLYDLTMLVESVDSQPQSWNYCIRTCEFGAQKPTFLTSSLCNSDAQKIWEPLLSPASAVVLNQGWFCH